MKPETKNPTRKITSEKIMFHHNSTFRAVSFLEYFAVHFIECPETKIKTGLLNAAKHNLILLFFSTLIQFSTIQHFCYSDVNFCLVDRFVFFLFFVSNLNYSFIQKSWHLILARLIQSKGKKRNNTRHEREQIHYEYERFEYLFGAF